jgi:hypothetical protein
VNTSDGATFPLTVEPRAIVGPTLEAHPHIVGNSILEANLGGVSLDLSLSFAANGVEDGARLGVEVRHEVRGAGRYRYSASGGTWEDDSLYITLKEDGTCNYDFSSCCSREDPGTSERWSGTWSLTAGGATQGTVALVREGDARRTAGSMGLQRQEATITCQVALLAEPST